MINFDRYNRMRHSLGLVLGSLLLTQCSDSIIDQNPSLNQSELKPLHEITGHNVGSEISWDMLKWDDDPNIKGSLLIVINKPKQMMYVYRGDTLIGYSPISSGRRPAMTPTGSFRIQQKELDHHSYYGSFVSKSTGVIVDDSADIRKHSAPAGTRFVPASMPYFMRIQGAVGIHQGFLPGYPASHGCIRLPGEIAKKLYNVASVGTKVYVTNDPNWILKKAHHTATTPVNDANKSIQKIPAVNLTIDQATDSSKNSTENKTEQSEKHNEQSPPKFSDII